MQQSLTFTLGAETSNEEWNNPSITLTRRKDGLHILSETLTHDGASVPLYTIEKPSQDRSTDVQVVYNNFLKGKNKPHVTCSDQTPIFLQLTSPATFETEHKESRERIPEVVKQLEHWLAAMLFLDPVPARMRSYSFPSDAVLQGDGANLSAVLYDLWGGDKDKAVEATRGTQEPFASNRKSILNFIQSLPEQDIAGLSFLEEPRGGVMVKVTETFGMGAQDYDAYLLSDGTLRVLAAAAAMLSAVEGSLVVIEEIDNGVHPSRAKHLLKNIIEVAEKRNLRVLLSTHNPALLDAIPDSAIPDVLFCCRDPKDGSSRIVRLPDVPDYPELIGQDSLGGLVTSGVLERFVKQHQESDRKARSLAWLESLKNEVVHE